MTDKIPSQPFHGEFPRPKKEEQEFGPGKQDILICPECNAVYFEKSWHHGLEEYRRANPDKRIKFVLCPADDMKKKGLFEGQVIIENIPVGLGKEVLNQVNNIAERAHQRDVLDRILDFHYLGDKIEIKTSENQLAMAIGKEIEKAHKGAEVDIQFSKGEDTARVRVWWPK
ncbi:MAG: hypothetical protein WD712_00935 [Candidatus Spechtbacterales bacterium]